MPLIRIRRSWEMPERLATPEDVYANRRMFMRSAGLGGLALGFGACNQDLSAGLRAGEKPQTEAGRHRDPAGLYPARRNPEYLLDRPVTDEAVASTVINYYEFTTDQPAVAALARDFSTDPWAVEVTGLVEKPRTWAVEEITRQFPL